MNQKTPGRFYDFGKLKSIPILDVCTFLGIPVETRGGKYWCKIRNERTSSVLLHTDKNIFYDFGSQEKGDNLQLTALVLDCPLKEAVDKLATHFGIEPEHRDPAAPREISDWEYQIIGLYGDLATKNFSFNVERMSIPRLKEISDKYSMSMNELKRSHIKTYEKILVQKAVPHLRMLRDNYLLDLYQEYTFLREAGLESLFCRPENLDRFHNEIETLQRAEKIFGQCITGTSLTPWKSSLQFDPYADLQTLFKGKIAPQMGTLGYTQIKSLAEEKKSTVKYKAVDYASYMISSLNRLPHSAFLRCEKVIVGYLDCDREKITKALQRDPVTLTSQIATAAAHSPAEHRPSYNFTQQR